ncbi:hypothetical protein [Acidianus sp. HS-5]|uniref:hypothetical protein n=1 Tax=Acidianus sp. HS-5 TaxID=2886040 RepID=UPI001F34AFBD|nr:hypothetical protein [Acidianus sp. HS-5]BDC19599.1 hypothetical protein HS5_24890 [Acidianus sp. HS-5]
MNRLDKNLLIYLPVSAVPIAGSTIYSVISINKLRDFIESLPYVFLGIPVSLLTSAAITFEYFKQLFYISFIVVIITPLIASFVISRTYENVEVVPNEYYIEITLKVPISYSQFSDPNVLFDKVFNKALKKMKNPYYYYKLRSLGSCSNLRVEVHEDRIVLRKRCGDTIVEINLTNKDEAYMKVSISY